MTLEDPFYVVKDEVFKALNKTRGLYLRWQEVAAGATPPHIPEAEWTSTELKNALRSIQWDLEDLEDTISIVENNSSKFKIDNKEITERKKFIDNTRKEVKMMRGAVHGAPKKGNVWLGTNRPPTPPSFHERVVAAGGPWSPSILMATDTSPLITARPATPFTRTPRLMRLSGFAKRKPDYCPRALVFEDSCEDRTPATLLSPTPPLIHLAGFSSRNPSYIPRSLDFEDLRDTEEFQANEEAVLMEGAAESEQTRAPRGSSVLLASALHWLSPEVRRRCLCLGFVGALGLAGFLCVAAL